jgi:glc operon protein GlcG
MRNISALDHADAWAAIAAAHEIIKNENKPLVIAVVDSHGEMLSLFRHSSAMLSSNTIAANKAYTAARLRRPSSAVGQKSRNAEEGFDIACFGDPRMTGFGGGLPIIHDGQVLGAVGVSGLSEAEDIAVAQAAIRAIEARWNTTEI